MKLPTLVDIHKKNGKRPKFDVYIGRRVMYTEFKKDSKWANLFFTDLKSYVQHARKNLWNDLHELDNQKLGCWCLDTNRVPKKLSTCRCHGQVLMMLFVEKFKDEITEPLRVINIVKQQNIDKFWKELEENTPKIVEKRARDRAERKFKKRKLLPI